MSKSPQPGLVKKRLIPVLGENEAAHLYSRLADKVFSMAQSVENIDIQVWIADDIDHQFSARISKHFGFSCFEQSGSSLGDKIYQAMYANQPKYQSIVLIGCDCPGLTVDILNQAFDLLDKGIEAVLGPAMDGGYYLIGLKKVYKSVFDDIEWGSSSVAESTRLKFTDLGVRWQELPVLNDIDRPEDLVLLDL